MEIKQMLRECHSEINYLITIQQEKISFLEAGAFHLMIIYLVFEAVIFYAISHASAICYLVSETLILYSISQSSTLSSLTSKTLILYLISHSSPFRFENRWWIPFTLSLFASSLFFPAFFDAVVQLCRNQRLLDSYRSKQYKIYRKICPIGDEGDPPESELLGLQVRAGITISALIVFTGIMLYACISNRHDGDDKVEVLLELIMGHWSLKRFSRK
ncbi:hypothetical protein RJ641_033777 [Dillenia turbinata]|uniref:Uncharacterized protein n=1 Tax=Dillenia turbinata TaxID=194707 RepID=A0AAN8W0A3_9MAGN